MEKKNLIKIAEVLKITGLYANKFYQLRKEGKFPKPKEDLNWDRAEIEEWAKNNPQKKIKKRTSPVNGKIKPEASTDMTYTDNGKPYTDNEEPFKFPELTRDEALKPLGYENPQEKLLMDNLNKFLTRVDVYTDDFIDDMISRFSSLNIPRQMIINHLIVVMTRRLPQWQAQ